MDQIIGKIILFGLLACLWAGSFISVKVLVAVISPASGALLRVGLSLAFLSLWLRFSGRSTTVSRSQRRELWILGIVTQALPLVLLFHAEQTLSAGAASLFNATVPFWGFGLAALVAAPARKLTGLFLGCVGTAILITLTEGRGATAAMAMALCYAIGGRFGRKLMLGPDSVSFHAALYHKHWASTVLLIGVAAFAGRADDVQRCLASPAAIAALGYLVFVSTLFSWGLHYKVVQRWGANEVASVNYFIPMATIAGELVLFGVLPSWQEGIALVAILVGSYLMERTPRSVSGNRI